MNSATRLVIVTGHEFGIRAYEGLLTSDQFVDGALQICLAIGLHEGRERGTVGYRSLKQLAHDNLIEYTATDDGSLLALRGRISALRPHYILVVGWSSLVSPEILAIPELPKDGTLTGGCIGMHPTMLPLGRGQAPIPWTIIKGLEKSGLSVFFLEAGPDAGPIIAQYPVEIHTRQTSTSLFYAFAALHFRAGQELADKLATRKVLGAAQDETQATLWPKRRPGDGALTEEMTFVELDRLVRALRPPYPPPYVLLKGTRYTIASARLLDSNISQPIIAGNLTSVGGKLLMSCADGIAELTPYPSTGE